MARPQQRPNRNRRTLSDSAPPRGLNPFAKLEAIIGNDIVVAFYGMPQPIAVAFQPVPVRIANTPGFMRVSDNSLPIAFAQSDVATNVVLTYGGLPIGPSEVFLVGSFDPELRADDGSYVGQNLIQPDPPA